MNSANTVGSEGLNCTHFDGPTTTTFTLYDTVSTVCGDMSGLTFCGPRSLEILDSAGSPITNTLLTYSVSSTTSVVTITAEAPLESQVGQYSFKLRAAFADYTTARTNDQYVEIAFPVFVLQHPCALTSIYPAESDVSEVSILPGEQAIFNIIESGDTVGTLAGDPLTYCGERKITFFDGQGTVMKTDSTFTY